MATINERFHEFSVEGEDRVGLDGRYVFSLLPFFSPRHLFRPLKASESCIGAIMR